MTNLDLNVENLPNKKISDNQAGHDDSAMSIYNEKELKYLDKYLPTEDELYQIVLNCAFNDIRIERTIEDRLKYLNAKGIEYGWNVVDKKHRKTPVDFSKIVNKPEEGAKKDKKENPKRQAKKNKKNVQKKNYQRVLEENPTNFEEISSGFEYHSHGYKDQAYDYYKEAEDYSDKYYVNNRNYKKQYNSSYSDKDYGVNYNYYNETYSYNNKGNDDNYHTSSYNKGYKDNYHTASYDKGYKDNYYAASYKKGYEDYDYYSNYYYSQGYYDKDQGYQNYQKKRRPNDYRVTENNRYYPDNNYSSYSNNYKGKERKNNKNYRVIIRDLNEEEFIKPGEIPTIFSNEINEIKETVKKEDVNTETQAAEYNKIEKKGEFTEGNMDKLSSLSTEEKLIKEEKKEDSGSSPDLALNIKGTEIAKEIEEINVNKVDIENLRSYFDKFKHYAIFNETTQLNSTTTDSTSEKIQAKPFYDQFNNFKASSAIIRSFLNNQNNSPSNVAANEKTEKPEQSLTFNNKQDQSISQSKNQNNLTINKQILEITSSSSKTDTEFEMKKISSFSLSISGTDKEKKVDDSSASLKAPIQENKNSSNNINNQSNQVTAQPMGSMSTNKSPVPNNYMYHNNYTNMVNTQPINPYLQYEQPGYPNIPNRMNYAEVGHYNQEYMYNIPNDVYGQYDYPQYQYYGMPYRYNTVQYPGFPNYQFTGYPNGYMDRYAYMNPNAPETNYNAFPNYQMTPNPNMSYYPYNEQQKRK